jgi:NAD(P)-dependent dehydrogenase (short-subunit alcohol dehydrogenase family)
MVEYNFNGKVAFITGGAQGQGRQHALRYAQNGANVVNTDILAEELAETVELV